MQATKGKSVVQDFSNQLDQGLNYSILNTLRTGNMILDMLVCMLVPVLIRYILTSDLGQLWKTMSSPLLSLMMRSTYTRTIEYVEGGNTRVRFNPMTDDLESHMENTDRNNLLQKAIKLYMSEKYALDATDMEVNLAPTRKVMLETKKDMFGERGKFSGSYAQLLSFGVQMMPSKGQWILVDRERNIWFMQQVNEQQVGSENNPNLQTKTIFSIQARGSNAAQKVHSWIEEAFDWYKERRKSDQDTSRFFYVAIPSEKKEGQNAPKYLFKQYLLSDHKTFNSLFFPEKDVLLQLIDQFTNKTGKFAIEGFPDKLGLLLDGPPGTGKTSLIKALAHYLNRHVVSVNLAKIKTNQELMDLLFDLVFPVQGGDFPVKMKFKDIIFVMEDVDAASKVVYARKGSKAKPQGKAAKSAGKKKAAAGSAGSREAAKDAEASSSSAPADAAPTNGEKDTTAENGERDDKGDKAEKTKVPKAPPPPMPTLLRMISGNNSKGEASKTEEGQGGDDDPEDTEEEEDEEEEEEADEKGEEPSTPGGSGAKQTAENMVGEILCKMIAGPSSGDDDNEAKKSSLMGGFGKSYFEGDDDLNLAGLLNVLDGVVDSPGRVVVMTTNHPDKLDPALIRPGRINKRIHLGYVSPATMHQMAEHYMQVQLTPEQKRQMSEVAKTHSVTPAQMEQCCAESNTVEELVAFLAKHV